MVERRTRPSSAGVGWLRDKRILLAEDNVTNQMVATQMLDALGAKVDVANDGAEALEMIGAKRYDLFLIDIEMPRVSGLDVIRSIRSAEAPLRDAPVIAVTAYALREHRDKITEAGADGLIPKPLLGIEQFGRDIVALADSCFARSGGDLGADVEPRPDQLVALEVFQSLSESVGPDSMRELLEKIDADLERAQRSIEEGAKSLDRSALGAATHVLISVAGAIGAQGLQALAQRLTITAEGKGEADIDALAARALREVAAVRTFVREKIASTKG